MDSHMRSKVGLFGGTFDPIHFGHINLALALAEAHSLDEVIFCPTAVSPFKESRPPKASQEHRKEMVRLAIAPLERFSLLTTELERGGTSYTIDTIHDVLELAKAQEKEIELFLMLGEDALHHFHEWKEIEGILRLAPPLTGARTAQTSPQLDFFSPLATDIIRQGMTKVPIMEISSTAIRERLSRGQYCGHWVPEAVLEYINRHQLYLG